jgi:type II secretory pathway pseudopilin PulG
MKFLSIFFTFSNKRSYSLRGFTLVETLVSTMIITLVILGPLTVASNASMYARITKDSLIATYLAQESIELLRHQQDSIYIQCIQSSTSVCSPTATETTQQAAWRTFRNRLLTSPSCLNAVGCSYDFIDMTTNESATPPKYASNSASCNTLSLQTSTKLYVCTGTHATGGGYTLTSFSRSVFVETLPTISGSEQDYNDDLRVTVTVSFKNPNGSVHQIKVVDFLHARA